MIDICTTATLRAEILDRTLNSFRVNLIRDNPARLIINIDPVGPDDLDSVVQTGRKHFDDIVMRAPDVASFPVAFKWVWSQAAAKYVLHLEDDWELVHVASLIDMIWIIEDNPDLALLRLPWKPQDQDRVKAWRHFFPWNGRFFECPAEFRREVGFCGHPSLIRGEFVRRIAFHLDETRNPEKQFHHGPRAITEELKKWRFGVYGRPGGPVLVRDIGRHWMVREGYRKSGVKAFFTQWEKVNA